ncbi:MAG TPA: polymer-forming cytoskeletal protein, partial [Candidatus Polarisedimenticolia bacterium]|nr:polymer-forming cytoskeletal protein [Candidatus Polarisedimenticolia bacterium]
KRIDSTEPPPSAATPVTEREARLVPGSGRSLVGPMTRICGTLTTDGSLVVEGTVEGEIRIGGGLTVTPTGRVDADVEAPVIRIEGKARGSMRAGARVALLPGSSFEGEMSTPILEVRPGSVLQGRTRVVGAPARGRRGLSH